MWPISACLVAPGPTQAILPTVSLDCVFGFKPPETVMSALLHLGAEVHVSGKAPFTLMPFYKQEAGAWSPSSLSVVFLQSLHNAEREMKC